MMNQIKCCWFRPQSRAGGLPKPPAVARMKGTQRLHILVMYCSLHFRVNFAIIKCHFKNLPFLPEMKTQMRKLHNSSSLNVRCKQMKHYGHKK